MGSKKLQPHFIKFSFKMTLHFLHSGSSHFSATDCWTVSRKHNAVYICYIFILL